MSSAICINLDQSKISSSGNGLSPISNMLSADVLNFEFWFGKNYTIRVCYMRNQNRQFYYKTSWQNFWLLSRDIKAADTLLYRQHFQFSKYFKVPRILKSSIISKYEISW